MPKYTYIDRTTGRIGYQSITPLPGGVRVTLPNGHPGTFSEGTNDGSVRRGVAGPGQVTNLTETNPMTSQPGSVLGVYAIPTWSPSDWEQP